MKLDVGCGGKRQDGYKHLDAVEFPHVDYVCDAWDTPIGDGEVEHIRSRHFLEHLRPNLARDTLREWQRILRLGGTVWVAVPDLLYHCKQIFLPGNSEIIPHKSNFEHAMGSIYGWESKNDLMGHGWGYTRDTLRELFDGAGFVDVELPECRACDIELTARKR